MKQSISSALLGWGLGALGLLISACAIANDTVGAEAAGGIEFRKTDEISMDKEVLTLSHSRVRVEYAFTNKTDHSVTERVYFPMPFYSADNWNCHSDHGGGPLEDFKIWVNGQRVETSWTARAVLPSGKDVTAQLKRHGLSDQDIATYKGLVIPCEDENDDPAMVQNATKGLAAYGLKEYWYTSYVYYWNQEFPPRKTIKVVHEYTPRIGTDDGALSFQGQDGLKSAAELTTRVQQGGNANFCVDDGTYRAARKSAGAHDDSLRYAIVDYILITGANWSGPIKDFTLNLKKDNPDDVVSLCFDGKFRKTDALTLTSHLRNFLPRDNLGVLFLFPL